MPTVRYRHIDPADLLNGMRSRLRSLFRRGEREERMDAEIRFHLEMEAERNREMGMPRAEAMRQARLTFGAVEAHRETIRDGVRFSFAENLWQDLGHATKSLRRAPGLTLAVILSFAIGIGATTAMYQVMSRLLLRPPPHVANPEGVFRMYKEVDDGDGPSRDNQFTYQFLEKVRAEVGGIASASGYLAAEFAVGSGEVSQHARGTAVAPGFWETLAVRPALGRLMTDEEAYGAGQPVVVLGHGFWNSYFGADLQVIGQTLLVRAHEYRIIGVTPRGFRGLELADVDLWLPVNATSINGPGYPEPGRANFRDLSVIARLSPGVAPASAGSELSRLSYSYELGCWESGNSSGSAIVAFSGCGAFGPRPEPSRMRVLLAPLKGALGLGDDMARIPEARISVLLTGIGVLVLSVATTTVAGLLLLRSMRRRREIAVKLALGMGSGRLASMLFTESLLLAILGGVASAAVVVLLGAYVNRFLLPDLSWELPPFDWGTAAVTISCILGAAVLATLTPLLYSRVDPARDLRNGANQGASERAPMRNLLLATQMALCAVLLVGTGLFLRSLTQVANLSIGVDRERVWSVEVLSAGSGMTREQLANFAYPALERVQGLPGVESASLGLPVPFQAGLGGSGWFRLPADADLSSIPRGVQSPETGTLFNGHKVTPGYFATVGQQIVQGRDFLPEEEGDPTVILVNEAFAAMTWRGRSPLGECLPIIRGFATDVITMSCVIGVVENTHRPDLRNDQPEPLWYDALNREDVGAVRKLFVRLAPGSGPGAEPIRLALLEMDPTLPHLEIHELGTPLEPQMRPWRLGARVFTAFALLATFLTAVGLYSALGYSVTQRTRELGIRSAVGAPTSNITWLILRGALAVTGAGLVVGLVFALYGERWVGDLLFDVSPRDPVVFAAAGILLVIVAIFASVLPIYRAVRFDPSAAIRSE